MEADLSEDRCSTERRNPSDQEAAQSQRRESVVPLTGLPDRGTRSAQRQSLASVAYESRKEARPTQHWLAPPASYQQYAIVGATSHRSFSRSSIHDSWTGSIHSIKADTNLSVELSASVSVESIWSQPKRRHFPAKLWIIQSSSPFSEQQSKQ